MGHSVADPWTDHPALPRVFLLEAPGWRERRSLQEWIAAERARHGETGTVVDVPLSDEDEQIDAGDVERLRAVDGDCFLVPLRALRHEGRSTVLVGEGATLTSLRALLAQRSAGSVPDAQALGRFIRRQALLALDRAERDLRGARYKLPRLLEDEVLGRARLVNALAEEAGTSGRPLAALTDEARACLREMAPRFHPRALDWMAAFGRYLYTRGFDREIDVLDADLARVRELSRRHPVAFLMTHKSHLDGFLVITLFWDLNLPPVHVFGGINMSFFGLGALGKRSGAIFIRRTMTGDNVYKAVFKQYIDYLAEKRFPLLWALEGTRSRTGKLMPPRYGLINYVVDSYVRAASTDMVLLPVAIAYDQVPEVGDYIAEQKGILKRPESARWFLQYIAGLHNPFGRIHVRFGKGVRLSEVLGDPHPGMRVEALDIQKIAFRLSVDANEATPVLGTSLIAWVMTAAGGRALTLSELRRELHALSALVRRMHLPTSGEIDYATPESLDLVLGQLVHTGVLARHGGAREPLYSVARDATMAAAYYRNGCAHFLVDGAIAELALVTVAQSGGTGAEQLHEVALRLRDLFKFEFFFHDKARFVADIDRNLDLRAPGWRAALAAGMGDVYALLWSMDPLLAHGTLRPFVESYLAVAEALLIADIETVNDAKALSRLCMQIARERALQGRITSEESAARVYLDNGLQLARARSLIGASMDARRAHHDELATLAQQLAFIASAAENRRFGVANESAAVASPWTGSTSMYGHLTEGIARSPRGAHIAALFDLDRTLLEGFSVISFLRERLMSGTMSPREMQANAAAFTNYSLGKTGLSGVMATTTRALAGVAEKTLRELGEQTFEKDLSNRIYPEARALVEAHRARGHTIAIVSSATRYQIAPVARALAIEHVMCTELEVVDGVFTGEVAEACWKEGKAIAARRFAASDGLDLGQSWFYTDASEDLALLDIVGHPHPLNPDKRLAVIAERRGWPVHRFAKRNTGLAEKLRTALAYAGMIPAIAAGAQVRLLTGSARKGANATIGTWVAFAAAAVGLDLRVNGSENLWKRRPAVFVFNHQSAADVMILGKLLERDFTGIAKIEAASAPLAGPLLKAAGVVFIDRADRAKAIEALAPAVQALKNGVSLVIAPEGTRSETAALGPFKKGAFHMAMEAGVPMVPVIVHNAIDAQQKHEKVFRPATVYIEVLEPIDTGAWSVRTLDAHVAEVRALFLRALSQPDDAAQARSQARAARRPAAGARPARDSAKVVGAGPARDSRANARAPGKAPSKATRNRAQGALLPKTAKPRTTKPPRRKTTKGKRT